MDSQFAHRRNFLKKRSSPLSFGFTAIADFSSLIGQEFLAGIMHACEQYGINFINLASTFRPSLFMEETFFKEYLEKTKFMHGPLLDGLITWASSLHDYMKESEIQRLFSSLSPLPMVDIGYLDIPGVPSIRIDNQQSVALLVEHLVSVHGFKKIAFLGSSSAIPHRTRLEMFRKAMALHNLPVNDNMVFMTDSLGEQDVDSKISELMSIYGIGNHLSIDAIITASDIIAKEAISSLKKRGLCVPDDVAVTGFNNQLSSLTAPSPVTTIDLAYFNRGYKAVEILIDRIMAPQNALLSYRVPTSLVIRQSCGCFEESVFLASGCGSALEQHSLQSELEVRTYLRSSFEKTFSKIGTERIKSLITASLSDIYGTNVPPPFKYPQMVQKGTFSSASFGKITEKQPELLSLLKRRVFPQADSPSPLLRQECPSNRKYFSRPQGTACPS